MELVSCLSLPVYLLPISFHLTLLRLPFYLSLCQNASSLLSSSPLSVSLLMAFFFSPFLNLILTSLLPCQFVVPLFSSSVPLSFTPPPSHYFQLLLTIFLSLCHSSSFLFLDHLFLPPFLQISALFLPDIRAIFPSFLFYILYFLLTTTPFLFFCSYPSPAHLQSSSFLVAGRGKEEAEFTVEVQVSQVLAYLRSGDQVPEDRRQNRGQRSQTPCEPNITMILGLTRRLLTITALSKNSWKLPVT